MSSTLSLHYIVLIQLLHVGFKIEYKWIKKNKHIIKTFLKLIKFVGSCSKRKYSKKQMDKLRAFVPLYKNIQLVIWNPSAQKLLWNSIKMDSNNLFVCSGIEFKNRRVVVEQPGGDRINIYVI